MSTAVRGGEVRRRRDRFNFECVYAAPRGARSRPWVTFYKPTYVSENFGRGHN